MYSRLRHLIVPELCVPQVRFLRAHACERLLGFLGGPKPPLEQVIKHMYIYVYGTRPHALPLCILTFLLHSKLSYCTSMLSTTHNTTNRHRHVNTSPQNCARGKHQT